MMMISMVNTLVLAGMFVLHGPFCSALPTQSTDTQRKTVTYFTPDGASIVEEISVIGDTVEIDTADITLLSNSDTGLNTLIFKNEENVRCYVSPRASFPVNIEKELQNDVIEAAGVASLELVDTDMEVDPEILDEVAYKKCKDIPTFWTLIKTGTKNGEAADDKEDVQRMRRCVRFCYRVCVNGYCYQRCTSC